MKTSICDICFNHENKTVKAIGTVGYPRDIKIDVCEEHKKWTDQFKTPEELRKGFMKMRNRKS